MRWLGIDFSGSHLMWRPGCQRSNVWVADVASARGTLVLTKLRRVQELPGQEHPFDRLARLLRGADYAAAAIDAPLSVPSRFLPPGGHRGLLELGATLPADGGRPFPRGRDLLAALKVPEPTRGLKVYRATENEWTKARVNTRSTLWAGARGGAPMTAACLALLAAACRPLWPCTRSGHGLIAEAFPAAQLTRWELAATGYNGGTPEAAASRAVLLDALAKRIRVPPGPAKRMRTSADALDAVLCAFAAIAVTEDRLASAPGPSAHAEGWIAVHE